MRPITQPLRYSPQPIEAYSVIYGDSQFGPAQFRLLREAAAWNLAFLSHDFDKKFHPDDAKFSVHVRRTLQTPLSGEDIDITVAEPFAGCIGSLLYLSAPIAVYRLSKLKHLTALPMYRAYGPCWFAMMDARAKVFSVSDDAFPKVRDMRQAKTLLKAIAARR